MASLCPLPLHSPLVHGLERPKNLILTTSFRVHRAWSSPHKRSPISASSSPSNQSNWDREEIRWLREEQRWLREEQRWIREESRWNSEREALLREIAELKLRIQNLEHLNSVQGASVSETVTKIASLLQTLKDSESISPEKNWIPESGSSPVPILLESESEEVKEMVVQGIGVSESDGEDEKMKLKTKKAERVSLRKGSEGEDVRAMQEALQKLGFYSGEEDMEYSSFSSGTERAVKTWQATLSAHEDGIMTAELLERLFLQLQLPSAGLKLNADQSRNVVPGPQKENANGAAVTTFTGISEVQQISVNESGVTGIELSERRVFLLGENRWEEPSRLVNTQKDGGSRTSWSTTKCLTCRGEGRLLCTECDGTGEPNVEPQFLEWVDEGAKCPYCEGLGYTICDVCDGKAMV